jgi:polar amino acid transport system substrate-binding protein
MNTILNTTKKVAAALIGLACLAQAAHAATPEEIKQRKKVLVAIDLGTPPFGSTDEKMQPQGSDVDVARMLAKDLGVELEIVPVTGPNRIPYLMTNKVDMVISSFSISPERAKVVAFSNPYGAIQFVVQAPKSLAITKVEDLVGKRTAVVRGNIQDTLLTPIAPKGATIVRYDDDATTSAALLSGQVDAVCTAGMLANAIARQNPAKQLETKFAIKTGPYAVGMRQGDTELKKWVDDWIAVNLKNGRLGESYQRWIGSPLPDLTPFTGTQGANAEAAKPAVQTAQAAR